MFIRLRSFNSEMVRLKAATFCLEMFLICCFNSEMVRLKAALEYEDDLACTSFNSEMVRLKDYDTAESIFKTVVSIPKWFD